MKGPRETDFAYQAVYRYLTNLINEPVSDTRVRLPSLRQLAERLSVSISTIQYAKVLPIVNAPVKNTLLPPNPVKI
jgi:DNA-binding GntR family transcriptional regulator